MRINGLSERRSAFLPQNLSIQFITRHIGLAVILIIALIIRASYLSAIGINDLRDYVNWGMTIAQHGLFSIYAQNAAINYAPIFLIWIGLLASLWLKIGGSPTIEAGSHLIILIKLLSLLAELGIIALAYAILPARSRLRWIVPTLLALYPGLIVVTAFWGQIDALFTLPLLIAFVLLRRNHPRAAWGIFTLALLVKIQAVVALPLLLMLTYRRFGWRTLLAGISLTAILFLAAFAPFMIGSGLFTALKNPYFGAIGQFPSFTLNALNLWFLVTPSLWISHPPLLLTLLPDSQTLIGIITAKQFGLLLLAIFMLFVLMRAWRNADQPYEFVWLTALYFGFFMLPTEIHERYLYPAAICSLLAVADDRRMWSIAVPTVFTFSYNMIFPSQAPFYWLGFNPLFLLGDMTITVALLNVVTFAALIVTILGGISHRHSWPLKLLTAAMVIVVLPGILHLTIPAPLPAAAQPLDATVDATFQLQGYHLAKNDQAWTLDLYWKASAFNNADYTLFVHAVRGGQIIAQDDGRPQGGRYPTWRWFYNNWVVTEHKLAIPSASPPDEIDVGMYDPSTMIRAPAIQNGQPLASSAIRVWANSDS